MLAALGLALATFVSEDAACITAGLLIQRGELGWTAALLGCGVGILLGDWALWMVGRMGGHAALAWPWLARRFPHGRAEDLRAWLQRHDGQAIVASRFLPGTRLPLYVTAGLVRMSPARFALWTSLAVLLWTPTVVTFAAWTGDTLTARFSLFGRGWAPTVCAAGLLFLLLAIGRTLSSSSGRRRVAARLARCRRWEFWPMWLFYAPVAIWVTILAIRYRGLSTVTAANPGIPDGGAVGESKFDILERLPADCTVPAVLIGQGDTAERVNAVAQAMQESGWTFPIVLKPDVGQRGVGVRLARSVDAVREYLAGEPDRVLLQPCHEGPFEAGVFYYRMPGRAHGRILSITDKHFPVVVGDGRSTLEELIWSHPRYRMQASVFLRRHRDLLALVLASGERYQLAFAGNHAQGTLFRDGSHLITPALESRVDQIARAYPGFFVGRFDIRYRDVAEFKAGRGLSIVELNGATAESTNIYDPDGSLFQAYRQLFRQWAIVFAIGAANRAAGVRVTSTRRLIDLIQTHLTRNVPYAISD